MKYILPMIFLATMASAIASPTPPLTLSYAPAKVAACFRPDTPGGCVSTITNAIDAATSSIRLQAYNFTAAPILQALANAKKRGVDVQIILDKSNDPLVKNAPPESGQARHAQGRYTGATFMVNAGIPVYIDRKPRIAHNKIIIIDQHLIIGGSYNYTQSAEKSNAENVTFIDSETIAHLFLANWQKRLSVSEEFVPPHQ
jgi:phospholipase D